jgi:hypothetical protein
VISFVTPISGKPVDGVLLQAVAVGLAWDTGRRAPGAGEARGTAAPLRSPQLGAPGAIRHRGAVTAALAAAGAAWLGLQFFAR